MSQVELRNIGKAFGAHRVLSEIDLSIQDGEFLTLVGPSGCGKSTLIRIIAGLERQSEGSISIDGASIDHLRPYERRVSMVFQSYALYPHMTVFDNIAVPLTVARMRLYERMPLVRLLSLNRRKTMQSIAEEVRSVAAQLKIEPLLDRKPAQLSGGQRQRVALGRAMVRRPHAFLMDEPLSNLDAKLRVHMRTELTDLHKRMGATFIYVTHDQVEAMTMSDRVAMMDGGSIQQLGTPSELYDRPANLEVARFIGSPTINTMAGRVGQGGVVELRGSRLLIATRLPEGSEVTVGVRAEGIDHFRSSDRSTVPDGRPAIPARLRRMENLGAERLYYFDLLGDRDATIVARSTSGSGDIAEDETIDLAFDPHACHIFDATGLRVEHRPIDNLSLTRGGGGRSLASGGAA